MKKEIIAIKERNKRVEIDKVWETSKTRRAIITIMTYFIVAIFLLIIKVPYPFLSALVPALGFILSTLTLPYFKSLWVESLRKR